MRNIAFIGFWLVILSSIIHSLWNLFAKKSIDKITFFWSIHTISFVLLLPYFLTHIQDLSLEGYTILILFGSLFFQVIYVVSLSLSYSLGDYSISYPILRGTASLLTPLLSIILLNERITILGWIGILIIFIGIYSMNGRIKLANKNALLVFVIAIIGGFSITGYTLTDNALLDHMDPIMIFQFQNIIHLIAFAFPTFTHKKLKLEWQYNWKTMLLGVLFVPGSYIIFLYALHFAQVGMLAPIRETSIVFGVLLGILFLQEKENSKRKIISSIGIVIGVFILSIFG